VKQVKTDVLGLVPTVLATPWPATVTPTVAIEYFFTPNISVETIAGVTAHHVSASAGALKGTDLISKIHIIPATLTAKFHMPLGHGIKPMSAQVRPCTSWLPMNPAPRSRPPCPPSRAPN
jgi:outer membrane protein